jgi:hypothetical protein
VVSAHPHGKLLNFCPGLAEVLTGSATTIPGEMERIAAVVSGYAVVSASSGESLPSPWPSPREGRGAF